MRVYFIQTACLLLELSSSSAVASPSLTISAAAPAFTYNRTNFLLHGEPHQIIGGQMDPQRIPPAYWRDRLQKARAMGLNTVFSYVFWNMLEPIQGTWSNTGENDIAAFFRIAHEENLNIVLRPGPYICGERDWGGFPAWLATIPGMVVRSNNEPFLKAAKSYLERLAGDIHALQITRGGPILMVQVENEYGSFGNDHDYTSALRDMLQANFETVLYTNDGGVEWTLEGGSVPGVLAEVDGDPSSGFSSLRKYITDPSQQGPLLDGEYYTWAPDQWGSYNLHNASEGRPEVVEQFMKDLDYVLSNESASISLYMFHGGTNFGFSNGALWQNRTTVFTSSYDYGSPLDESGRTTNLYSTFRDTIQKYVQQGSIPDVPLNVPRMKIPEFGLMPAMGLFDLLGPVTTATFPLTMEGLGQAYGFTLYEHMAITSVDGFVQPGDRARDRVLVYVDGALKGVIDSQYQRPLNVSVHLTPGTKLQLLVENLGRVDYYSRENPYRNYVQDPYKGIFGNVTINGVALEGWDMYPLPLVDVSKVKNTTMTPSSYSTPLFYRGTFSISRPASTQLAELDTFLAIPAGVKGNVWVNGFHLGRYWRVGPQQSLYLPGTVVKAGGQVNEVVVLELEPSKTHGPMTAVGLNERMWGNELDQDCLQCV
ncbi:family 35 glycoside hydrolase [Lindgomyces ingoldianus]|uniref:Family 35 glycoside hydrolase n=1 Tax=Lindgomyces ingoldianus TaxID=673940 RepID=A0ACB6R6W5_9PLEO|nr:family 35 glycoside hydrolase [Lindgomyces ingoldianus]KAF2475018.1 family 35 glycoside hydrolase [Lindgomyces ingoldianus]